MHPIELTLQKWLDTANPAQLTTILVPKDMAGTEDNIRLDIDTLQRYCGYNVAVIKALVSLANQEFGTIQQTIQDAFDQQDHMAIRRVGHKLYGSAATLGLIALADLARKQEGLSSDTEIDPQDLDRLLLEIREGLALINGYVGRL